MSHCDPLVKVVALALLQMEKIMSAELDRLNAAVAAGNGNVADLSVKVDAVAAKIADLQAQIANIPAAGVDPTAVNDAAAQVEALAAAIAVIRDKVAGL